MDATSATPCTEHAKGDESQDVTVVSPSRLCDLPDEILIHILSFLKTKEAARTCILSKRWVDLWTSLPDLRFDGREIGNVSFMEDPFTTLSLIHGISPKTIEYIDRAFRLRDPQYTIRTFSLEQISVLEDVSCRRIIACINAAIRCKVQNLSLGIYNFCFSFVLPDSIFRCSTLVKLELGLSGLGTLSLPSSVQLSSLKVLKLSGVIFADDESVRKLFSCPLLEVLKIRRCNFIDITKLEISSPKLRVLSIDERSGSNGYRAMINGTNLESFHYGGDFVNEYVMVGKCEKLVKAKFTVYHQRNRRNRAAEHGYKLLASVSGTRNLILRYEFIEAITCGRNSNVRINLLPVFGNLIHLEVVEMVYIHLHSLFAMLRKFPHLQSLELLLRRGDDGEDHEAEGEGDELGDAPSCFSTHLKEIIIKEFCGIDNEFNTVGILLKNAVVLENLFIECTEELSTCNIEKLQLLPRGSSNCRISIVRLFF